MASPTLSAAQRYFDAWNRHDPDGIVATFAPGGTYHDPTSGGELTGAAIGQNAAGLFARFPDVQFEVVSVAETDRGTVVAEWLMRGTNNGPMGNAPPTGRTVALPGIDLIAVEGDLVRSVRGYFDRRELAEQLGLQVLVQPEQIGPFSFGSATYVSTGKRTQPGAISLTALRVHSAAEAEEVRNRSRAILTEMLAMPGFISFFGGVVGQSLFTVSAWEDAEAPRQLLQGGQHREAMHRFFGPEFAVGGITTVWEPGRLNTMWVRCESCGQMVDALKQAGTCKCGASLPEHPPYW